MDEASQSVCGLSCLRSFANPLAVIAGVGNGEKVCGLVGVAEAIVAEAIKARSALIGKGCSRIVARDQRVTAVQVGTIEREEASEGFLGEEGIQVLN